MDFRLATKNLFLTYPRCDLPKEEILQFLSDKLADRNPHIRVARELHEDGHPHLHCFIRLERKLQTRTNRYFDYNGHHPNIQSRLRDLAACFEYVSKDNDFVDYGQPKPCSRSDKWKTIASSETEEEFWTSIRENASRDLVLNLEKLQYYAQYKFGKQTSAYTPPARPFPNLQRHQPLVDWVDTSLTFEVSPSRCDMPPRPPINGGRVHTIRLIIFRQEQDQNLLSWLETQEQEKQNGPVPWVPIYTGMGCSISQPSIRPPSTPYSTTSPTGLNSSSTNNGSAPNNNLLQPTSTEKNVNYNGEDPVLSLLMFILNSTI